LKIDLAGSMMDAYNLKVISKNIFLDSTAGANPYLVVKSDDGNNLLYVSSNEYYLKTNNYNENNKTGTKINLKDGRIDSYGFTLSTSNIYLSDKPNSNFTILDKTRENIVLRMGSQFGVDNTGKLYANNALIKGDIYATSGQIGNWLIDGSKLVSTGETTEEGEATSNGKITLDGATGTISGGTIKGATITGKIKGSSISGSYISGGTIDAGTLIAAKIESGSIGGWSINSTGIYTSKSSILSSGSLSMAGTGSFNGIVRSNTDFYINDITVL
jgi:hypothetical protein